MCKKLARLPQARRGRRLPPVWQAQLAQLTARVDVRTLAHRPHAPVAPPPTTSKSNSHSSSLSLSSSSSRSSPDFRLRFPLFKCLEARSRFSSSKTFENISERKRKGLSKFDHDSFGSFLRSSSLSKAYALYVKYAQEPQVKPKKAFVAVLNIQTSFLFFLFFFEVMERFSPFFSLSQNCYGMAIFCLGTK